MKIHSQLILLLLITISAIEAKTPNLVLILADDLGYGDLSCFGQKTLKTPQLDKMASEGIKFSQFYAGSTVCVPSRSVLMTGKHMGRTTIRGNSTKPIILKPGQETIANLLKGAGYRTACIGKWGLGTPNNFTNPNDVGFDHFYGYVNMWHAHNFYPEFLIRNGKVEALENKVAPKWEKWQDPKLPQGGRGVAIKKAQYAPELLVEDALRFIHDSHVAEKPFFLFFSMNVPHANNEAGNQGMEVPELYEFEDKDWPEPEKGFAAMLRNIDRDTGLILDLLQRLGIAEETLVIFTSDNGPHQEGGHRADFFNSNGPYRGIKRDLYEGGIRVPTIAWWPDTIKPGTTNKNQWYFGDLMATAAELAETTVPKDLDSDSFLQTLKGNPPEKEWTRESLLYWEFYERGSAHAVRFGKWKAIRSPMFTGPIQLYDLSWDHAEKNNYAERRPKLVEHARNLFNKAHEEDPNWPSLKKR